MSKHTYKPRSPAPRLVALIVYDGLCTFEFSIGVEVFGQPRPEFDFPWYDFTVVSAEGSRLRAMGGITIEASARLDALNTAETVIIPGWRDCNERPPEQLLRSLDEAARRGARLLSICSGVFVLAAAGLLRGKRATTHWRHMPALREYYPDILVEEDVLYVDEGNIITSAGSAAGIDACVHLVRRDFGPKIANSVARRLVMPPHRDGGQAQYVSAPVQHRPGRNVSSAMDWARERLCQPLTVGMIAEQAAMSERTLLRHFHLSLGMSPTEWLQKERMFRAKDLLETTALPLEHIAEQCGYRSLETFRSAFRRIVGTSPAKYRVQFASV